MRMRQDNLLAMERPRGQQYLDDPTAHPEDQRYAQFLEKIEIAELESKKKMIKRIMTSTDDRTLRWWCQNRWPKEFKAEHLSHEISGPDGSAIPLQLNTNPFQVNFHMSPQNGPEPEFRVVDRRPPEQKARDNSNGQREGSISGSVPLPKYDNRIDE
jgi:hypothetical protein